MMRCLIKLTRKDPCLHSVKARRPMPSLSLKLNERTVEANFTPCGTAPTVTANPEG